MIKRRMVKGRVERLDFAERWLHDGLRLIEFPGGLLSVEVDMSKAVAFRQRMKESGSPVTYTHLIVLAAARVLAEHPELHRLVAGTKRLTPDCVDICLSVAGDGVVTPVVLVRDAANKDLPEIAREVREGAVRAKAEDEKMRAILRRWGWLVPAGVLRRALLRFLRSRLSYCRRVSGTFQISLIPSVDLFTPFLFNTAAVLAAGRVRDRVVAVDGKAVVRPTMALTCCNSHKIWNGMNTALFLNCVKEKLEEAAV